MFTRKHWIYFTRNSGIRTKGGIPTLGSKGDFMGITIHYKGKTREERRIEEIASHYEKKNFNKTYVDFAVEPRWIKYGYVHAPDYEEHWEKYNLSSWSDIIKEKHGNVLPERYKGIILHLDEGCEPLWLCFGKYDDWRLHNFTKTQYAKNGYVTHMVAAELLKELNPFVDELHVYDEAEYYETADVKRLVKNFIGMERSLKSFGKLVKEIAKKHNLKIVTGYDTNDNNEGK